MTTLEEEGEAGDSIEIFVISLLPLYSHITDVRKPYAVAPVVAPDWLQPQSRFCDRILRIIVAGTHVLVEPSDEIDSTSDTEILIMLKVSPHDCGLELKRSGPHNATGIIGLGVMGSRMAKNLLKAGHQVVVFDTVSSLVRETARLGAMDVTSPEEVARRCRIVILSLPSAETVRNVVMGRNGVISGLSRNSVVVDTSTTNTELPRELAAELLKKKCYFLDAPVSGGPEGAEKGTLTMMVGGDRRALGRCTDVLRSIAKSVIHVGVTGSGQKVKLFNQALVSVYFGAVAEAYIWSKKVGLGPEDLLKVIPTSWGDSPVFRHFISVVKSRNFSDGASIRIFRKDISLILDSARKNRVKMKLLELASSMYTEASRKGHDNDDASALLLLRTTDET